MDVLEPALRTVRNDADADVESELRFKVTEYHLHLLALLLDVEENQMEEDYRLMDVFSIDIQEKKNAASRRRLIRRNMKASSSPVPIDPHSPFTLVVEVPGLQVTVSECGRERVRA